MGSRSKFKQRTRVLSGREARRYGERERNREQRQADVDRFWALTPEERKQRMADNEAFQRISRNGITIEDLKYAEDEGFKHGYESGAQNTMETCYAAICLALNEKHGFGRKRCIDILNAVDERVTYCLSSADAIREVFDKLQIQINFKADIGEERVQEK